MPKVPPTMPLDASRLPPLAVLVTNLEVRPESSPPCIIVAIGHSDQAENPKGSAEIALSPPAAAQLSRLLKKAVKKYLRAAPEERESDIDMPKSSRLHST